ncbi:tetratricopeptide repeat protein [Parasphingopyxis marina]|uniref:Tetratricopeptide repeat protein n=1 Tax=Parasphingopyxis marina TaxID=2761622 RepID=A0A842HYW6_9SPHN|nr:tetratricopeptide repeat protein [Parasphingopyxis marina]MBC2777120.1 hypothetical protein [Parasphingopyxis marina]
MTQTKKNIAILVLGMHRSGTSALTRVINLAGWASAKTLMRSAEFNETGHWESLPIVRIDDRILAALDRGWADPKPAGKDWQTRADVAAFGDEAREAIASEFDDAGRIVVKDPRLSRLLPFWIEALAAKGYETRCLIAARHPLEIADSLARRDGMTREHALLLWQSHMIEAEYHSRGLPRALIGYDAVLSDWRATLGSAMAAIGAPFAPAASACEAIEAFLDPRHRHAALPADAILEADDIAQPFKDLYSTLQDGSLDANAERFDRLRRDWLAAWEALSPGPRASPYAEDLPATFVEQSQALENEGDAQEAITMARKAVEADPSISRHHHHLGTLLFRENMLDEADAVLRRAIALYPKEARYHHSHARLLQRLGRLGEARSAASRAAALEPGNRMFQRYLKKILADGE